MGGEQPGNQTYSDRKREINLLLPLLFVPSLFPTLSLLPHMFAQSPSTIRAWVGLKRGPGKATTNRQGWSNYRVTDTRWWSLRHLTLTSTISAASAQMKGYGGTPGSVHTQHHPISGSANHPASCWWAEKRGGLAEWDSNLSHRAKKL